MTSDHLHQCCRIVNWILRNKTQWKLDTNNNFHIMVALDRDQIICTWWRHQMETFSPLLAICAGIHRSPVNSPHKGQWRRALMFSLICAWMINGLSEQSWSWWFETPSRPLWRHYNETASTLGCTTLMFTERHGASNHRQLHCLVNSLFWSTKRHIRALQYWPFVWGQ